MSRDVCGYCWCPWGDDGSCGCPDNQTGGAMSNELPPLPAPGLRAGPPEHRDWYSADQMRVYARAARAQAERERDEALSLLRRIRASSVIDATDGEYWRLAIDALLKRREG